MVEFRFALIGILLSNYTLWENRKAFFSLPRANGAQREWPLPFRCAGVASSTFGVSWPPSVTAVGRAKPSSADVMNSAQT